MYRRTRTYFRRVPPRRGRGGGRRYNFFCIYANMHAFFLVFIVPNFTKSVLFTTPKPVPSTSPNLFLLQAQTGSFCLLFYIFRTPEFANIKNLLYLCTEFGRSCLCLSPLPKGPGTGQNKLRVRHVLDFADSNNVPTH